MSRVLFLQHDSVFENYGGIQYYLHDFVHLTTQWLGRENVRTLALKRSDIDAPKAPYLIDFVSVPKSGLSAKLHNRFSLDLYAKAKQLVFQFKPDLIVCGHVSLGPVASLLSKKTKVPYATIVYGMECWGDLWPQDEWALRGAKKIFSISHWTKNILVKRGYRSEQIEIVHPLIPSFYDETKMSAHQSDVARIATVARLDANEQYKGHDHTLEALSRVKKRNPELKFKYEIVGRGDDKSRLIALCQKLELTEEVVFTAPLKDREELKAFYQKTDLFVMPSRYGKWNKRWKGEGFGIVYVEAAACGVPSIAYRCGGVTDIILHEQTGLLVDPDNIESLTQAITALLKDPLKRKALGKQAALHVRSNFGTTAVRKELEKALAQF